MAELLETALGKRKAGAAGLDDDSMSDDSPASDKQPALASPEESSDAPEQSEAPDASLPTCLQAIQQPCWRNPQTRKLVCLLCPDRPLSHKLGDPWRFHSATNNHKRRLQRFRDAVTLFLRTHQESELPRDPRTMIGAPSQADKQTGTSATTSKESLEEVQRWQAIKKIDTIARKKQRRRHNEGLPPDPAIDQEALAAKTALGWTPESEDQQRERQGLKQLQKEEARIQARRTMPEHTFLRTLAKLEAKVVAAHKREEIAGRPYNPALNAGLERFKLETDYEARVRVMETLARPTEDDVSMASASAAPAKKRKKATKQQKA